MTLILKSFTVIIVVAWSLYPMNENPHKRKLNQTDTDSKHYKLTSSHEIREPYEDFNVYNVDSSQEINNQFEMLGKTVQPYYEIDKDLSIFDEVLKSDHENNTEICLTEEFKCCCGNFQSTLDELKIHVKEVHDKQCPFCNYKAKKTTALFYHIFIHTGDKPYKCEYESCGYATTRSEDLKKHKLTHTGEKPYKCDYKGCNYAATNFGNLKTHKLTHTGEKPYKCDYPGCEYATTQSGNLKKHTIKHNNNKKK